MELWSFSLLASQRSHCSARLRLFWSLLVWALFACCCVRCSMRCSNSLSPGRRPLLLTMRGGSDAVILVAGIAPLGAMSLKYTCPCLSDHRKIVSASTQVSGRVSSIAQAIIAESCILITFLPVYKGIIWSSTTPGSHGQLLITVHGQLADSYTQRAAFQVGLLPVNPVKAVGGLRR